jgi:adenosylcobinamide-GDP ribazoletransferase
MLMLPPARRDGLGAAAGRPGRRDVALGGALALAIALIALDVGPAVAALIIGALAALCVALLARRQIGGYTGDVLGAVQQASEVAMLFTIAAAL